MFPLTLIIYILIGILILCKKSNNIHIVSLFLSKKRLVEMGDILFEVVLSLLVDPLLEIIEVKRLRVFNLPG